MTEISTATPLAPTRSRVRTQARSKNLNWTAEEDQLLRDIVSNHPDPRWHEITRYFHGKSAHQVADRWAKVLDPSLVKGSWTGEEDAMIVRWVKDRGPKNWGALAAQLPGRISKQCRERWHNHLSPDVNKKDWTPEEDQILIDRQRRWGNKWSQIAADLPGRTDNAVKNRWNSSLKRRLERIERGQSPAGKRGRKPKRPSEAPNLIDEIPKPPKIDEQQNFQINIQNNQNQIQKDQQNQAPTPLFLQTPQFSPLLPSPATPLTFLSPLWSPSPGTLWAHSLSPFPQPGNDTIDKNDLVNIPGPKIE